MRWILILGNLSISKVPIELVAADTVVGELDKMRCATGCVRIWLEVGYDSFGATAGWAATSFAIRKWS